LRSAQDAIVAAFSRETAATTYPRYIERPFRENTARRCAPRCAADQSQMIRTTIQPPFKGDSDEPVPSGPSVRGPRSFPSTLTTPRRFRIEGLRTRRARCLTRRTTRLDVPGNCEANVPEWGHADLTGAIHPVRLGRRSRSRASTMLPRVSRSEPTRELRERTPLSNQPQIFSSSDLSRAAVSDGQRALTKPIDSAGKAGDRPQRSVPPTPLAASRREPPSSAARDPTRTAAAGGSGSARCGQPRGWSRRRCRWSARSDPAQGRAGNRFRPPTPAPTPATRGATRRCGAGFPPARGHWLRHAATPSEPRTHETPAGTPALQGATHGCGTLLVELYAD
jgi:hypothetical protein